MLLQETNQPLLAPEQPVKPAFTEPGVAGLQPGMLGS